MSKVLIVMGSDSDLPVMAEAAKMLDFFSVEYELTIVSAHRTPERLFDYGKRARDMGFSAIIAGAGGAAHLPGMIASLTTLPVIGVPIKTNALSGVDSLYSIVQMPAGIPVATVAINGAQNAGILAAKMLAAFDDALSARIQAYMDSLNDTVCAKAEKLEKIGYKEYLGL